ncbi:hypothetical protein OU798_09920 [Prolixibacteraceae bacterium Z1-6]|uniref:Uncharacterized protein n=1 Tax=Draconibacterium aestuarii TaxID=2998507 RepID=A0A9X3J7F8_9BACT|nr:hypothetical protein [Prolixibacteraceae bacterium Z1-6]
MNAVIPKLPGDAERIEINGQMYWECYGTIYQAVRTPQGRGYQVVGNIDW